ncbi:DUF171-domain-containing protein [Piedraia hortae CBS 480.64]|uniref:DUF171-domain-containing protein n=1 Tax=Piedraia hortae CBS 480.64 TaxID=1314780 RepID=A0A6A7C2K5_9PEZI|nr:DUF171-domain-containing protein [Piedraia hortae CBS 480.64]
MSTPTQSQKVDTSKPTASFTPKGPRSWTLSIALPGSIISNSQTHESKTLLASTIARASTVFNVDEIVVFDDRTVKIQPPESDGYTAYTDPNFFLYRLLTFLETPPVLRRSLFGIHPDLKSAGATQSIDAPHHLKPGEECRYREGVVVEAPPSGKGNCYVNVGFPSPLRLKGEDVIDPGTRVTVRLSPDAKSGEAVHPATPREEDGYYWGYATRFASSLSDVFTECPFDGGYDFSIGTSERGSPLGELKETIPRWRHCIVFFGGVSGLETAVRNDPVLEAVQVHEVFDRWVNLLQGQGSRTIRTEEAVWIGLMGMRRLVEAREKLKGS